jgi:Flp pilus assembly protein TadD
MNDYGKTCFVIMPFGKKKVGDKEVDFDFIYDHVFKPAVESVDLPEGGRLVPRRTDHDYFSGLISQEMFEYIEYSRFALADVSGLNANVFYELGVRHRAHESGTAIFRQETAPPPFDIGQVKAFPYEYEPESKVAESVVLIKKVLSESLVYNRLDSPVMQALGAQRTAEQNPQQPDIEPLLVEADNALRFHQWTKALEKYGEALVASPKNTMVRMKRGLVLRDQGKFAEAVADFTYVEQLLPNYAEALREKGIAENKVFMKELKKRNLALDSTNIQKLEMDGMASGEASLSKAIDLRPDDFDALSSLGGVLKRQGRMQEAYEQYVRAVDVSQGNSYPLLNSITIKAQIERNLTVEPKFSFMLKRAARSLKDQVKSAVNMPWCAFDLAQVSLYLGDSDSFIQHVTEGIIVCSHKWQPGTFRETLELLTAVGVDLPRLKEGIALLKEAESLPE